MLKHDDKKYIEILTIKLLSYNELVITEAYDDTFNKVIKRYSHRDSNCIDNSILFQVYVDRVDKLITEDRLIHKKYKYRTKGANKI